MKERAKFITLEGSEACGKSTQLERLNGRLVEKGQHVIVTREPGGTPLGESVRFLLKHAPEGRGMTPEAELLLFSASRAELVRKVIAPALIGGAWVLSDRFYDSTFVYQGIARGLGQEPVASLNSFVVGGVHPGLTLVLDLNVEESLERIKSRVSQEGSSPDRIEDEEAGFFLKVREGYQLLSCSHPDRVKMVDASGTPDQVESRVWKEVSSAFQF